MFCCTLVMTEWTLCFYNMEGSLRILFFVSIWNCWFYSLYSYVSSLLWFISALTHRRKHITFSALTCLGEHSLKVFGCEWVGVRDNSHADLIKFFAFFWRSVHLFHACCKYLGRIVVGSTSVNRLFSVYLRHVCLTIQCETQKRDGRRLFLIFFSWVSHSLTSSELRDYKVVVLRFEPMFQDT